MRAPRVPAARPTRPRIYLCARNRAREPWSLLVPTGARERLGLSGLDSVPVRLRPGLPPVWLPLESASQRPAGDDSVRLPVTVERQGDVLVLAPLVGILAASKEGFHHFYGHRPNFRGLSRVAHRLGLPTYVFTPQDVAGERVRANVFTGEGRGGWRRVYLPFPAVVYNRIPDRASEQGPEVVRLKQRLLEEGIPFFNAGFFNKRQILECLARSRSVSAWLPRTEALTKRGQLDRWLREERLIYIKPVEGRAGEGIIRLEVSAGGYRWVQYEPGYEGARQVDRTYSSRGQVVQALWQQAVERDYVLQRGIELARYEEEPFDVCLFVQKGRGGDRWSVTGMVASGGGRSHITTHYAWLGEAGAVLEGTFGPRRASLIQRRLRRLGPKVARVLERHLAEPFGRIGEMSIDIGVAKDGSLWIFEANSKPMLFTQRGFRLRSWLRSLRYCEFLGRQSFR